MCLGPSRLSTCVAPLVADSPITLIGVRRREHFYKDIMWKVPSYLTCFIILEQVQLMMPDDFPDITPSNRYYQPRPKEAFGGVAEATLEAEADDRQQMPTMQLRCELDITNMGELVIFIDLWFL